MLNDYPCPQCGYGGPHGLVSPGDGESPDTYECGNPECYAEFDLPHELEGA